MTKKRIALDMDEVLADVVPKLLDIYESTLGIRPLPHEYRGRKVYETKEAYVLRKHLYQKGFFSDLPVMAHSQEVVRWLQEDLNYEVFVITSTTEFVLSLEDKYHWLQANFPFISWKNYIFCGTKHFMSADFMIDDKVKHLEQFDGQGLLFTASHNVDKTGDFVRVNNWLEIQTYFEHIHF